MIQKSEYFELTDLYINSELSQDELSNFESLLINDSILLDELNLQKEVQIASCEQDVMNLRKKLNQIVQNQSDNNRISSVTNNFLFDLTEDNSLKEFNQINADDFLNLESSLPKIHLYQHKIASKENIHQFYKEQLDSSTVNNEDAEFSPFDENLFTEIQSALEENDIAELRANLKQVAVSVPEHKYSAEDIEDFIYNRLDLNSKQRFEEELAVNKSLAKEVLLVKEIENAISENDIIELRANLNRIQHNDIQQSAKIEDIEKYLNNELSFDQLTSFEAELNSNKKLLKEVDLIKDIDQALAESDIIQLRNNLKGIADQIDADKQKERSFIGKINFKRAIPFTSVAASIVLILTFSGIFSNNQSSSDLYQKFYTKYEILGNARSADLETNSTFAIAMQMYENKEYSQALYLFGKITASDPNNMASHFYSGVSLQETGKYNKALQEYQAVITNKDNLFTEQAEWYTGLCLMQTNDNKKAYKQFKKIALAKGFYQQKAEEILKKIKYTD